MFQSDIASAPGQC